MAVWQNGWLWHFVHEYLWRGRLGMAHLHTFLQMRGKTTEITEIKTNYVIKLRCYEEISFIMETNRATYFGYNTFLQHSVPYLLTKQSFTRCL